MPVQSIRNPAQRVNPYVGPRPFLPGEELFGRDREKRDLFDQLLAERIVLLHSPSGAGKSSLVNAGLIPLLKAEGLTILPVVRVGEEPPEKYTAQEGFNRYLFSMMLSMDGELAQAEPGEEKSSKDIEQEAQRKQRQDELSGMPLAKYLAQRRQGQDLRLNVIVFDQFEEIITAAPTDLRGKQAFFRQIGDALSDRSLWALFVIRDDYLGALEPYALSIPTQLTNTFRLDLLNSSAAKQAIQKPVAPQGITFLDSAAQKLVDDMRVVQTQAPGGEIVSSLGLYVEPVQLQVVCLRLYDQLEMAKQLDKTQIDDEDIKKVGDVGTALANYYSERIKDIAGSPREERRVRDWFDDYLITKSGLRSQVMMEVGSSGGLDNEVIRKLGRAHLVRAEKRRGVTWFELAHDRLVRPVQRDNERWRRKNLNPWQLRAIEWQKNGEPDALLLRGSNLDQALTWAEANPDDVTPVEKKYLDAGGSWREKHLSPLQRGAAEWEVKGRPENLLLGGAELQQASEWAMANTDEISGRELEYLQASREFAEEQLRKQREKDMQLEIERERANVQEQNAKRLSRLAYGLAVVTLIAVVFAVFATFAQREAILNARLAEQQQSTAQAASTEAYENAQQAQVNAEEARAAEELANKNAELAESGATMVAYSAATAQAASTAAVAQQVVAEDNAQLAMANEQMANEEAGRALSRQLASQARSYLTRRPDLGILLGIQAAQADIGNYDARGVLLEGLRTGLDQSVVPYELNLPTGMSEAKSVDISQDGRLVVWSGSDGRIVLWDVITRSMRNLEDPLGAVLTSQALSPTDPNLLVVGTIDNQLLFWDLSDGTFERVRASGTSQTGTRYNHGRVRRLEFSPDGRRLAIHGQTANIAIWDVESRSELLSFKAQPDFYWDMEWSPDNRYLAAAGGDNYLYVFDPISGRRLVRELNPDADGRVYNVDWSPDSRTIAFAGASGSRFAMVYFYDMANKILLKDSLKSDNSTIYTVSYNEPKGDLIVAAGINTPVEIWRLNDGSRYPPLPAYGDYQTGLSFKNDLLAYLGFDSISVYEIKDPQPLSTELDSFAGKSPVAASYGLDELRLAGPSGNSLLLEQRDGEQTQRAQPGAGFPAGSSGYSLAFSPERTVYVVPQGSGELYHWDPASNSTELVTAAIPTSTSAIAVSSDGIHLAAGFCMEVTIEQVESLCGVQLYDLQARTPLDDPIGTGQTSITSLAFDPRGNTLASGDQDGTIYLIDVGSRYIGDLPLGGFSVSYTSLAFSPDGSTLASGTDQGLLFLWDMSSGQVIGTPFQMGSLPLTGLAYSPEGGRLYAAAEDGQVSAWDVDYESWVQRACAIAGRSLDRDEWSQFLGELPYEPACQDLEPPSTPTPTP